MFTNKLFLNYNIQSINFIIKCNVQHNEMYNVDTMLSGVDNDVFNWIFIFQLVLITIYNMHNIHVVCIMYILVQRMPKHRYAIKKQVLLWL